ncbi:MULTISPECIES: cation diffusion facilitator family transporter [Polaromonas]|jgi:cation diffusion facilitator family transporter|uniref:Divalent metal cation transporter, CDF family n=1 Tax=Polaromonas sp. H6N TaxID=1840293 RepID=A0A2S1FIA0_9BURK|nr:MULTISPECIES: cation diffusion facilitator family transporter [Polaromonas]AWD72242.1 divalent metal cation transporter, CDF family [Polaromonas sp. H6N]
MADSKIAIYGAIAANVAIAVTKFVVAGITGSSAMLSEGIHSAVDAGNGGLLLVGLHMAKKPATPEYPFGRGKELYFWSLIVAVLIFGLGGGMSIYEGVVHMREPEPLTDPFWIYVVLAMAAVFEGASFLIALRQFLRLSAGRPFWSSLHGSKDPSLYTVLAEDGAALAGLAVAAAGVWASHSLDMPVLDGAASVVIGCILAGVAVLLIRESRGLLVGEGVRPETAAAIRAIAQQQPQIKKAGLPLTMYIGADDVLLALDVVFADSVGADDAAATVEQIERTIRERFPKVTRIYIESRHRIDLPDVAG